MGERESGSAEAAQATIRALGRRQSLQWAAACLATGPAWAAAPAAPAASPMRAQVPEPSPYRVLFLAFDFRNGGITAVYRAFSEACWEMKWTLRVINCEGSADEVRAQLDHALLDSSLDALVLGGFDETLAQDAWRARKGGRPALVGWHASGRPGPGQFLLSNVSTDPLQVAELAAQAVFDTARGQAGVVLFNDSHFEIANAKTRHMAQVLQQHPRCQVLRIVDLPIAEAARRVPQTLVALNQEFGRRWTHLIAINDVYLDSMHFPLASVGRLDVVGIAAGDGSPSAVSRIRNGRSAQYATIAEPIGPQGWLLADVLWRHRRGLKPNDQQPAPVVITTDYLRALGRRSVAETEAYKMQYRKAWGLGA